MEDMGKELSKRLVENKWEKKYKEIMEKSLKDDEIGRASCSERE